MTALETGPAPQRAAPLREPRYQPPEGTIDGIRAASFTPQRIRAMRAHAVSLRNSGLLLMMEQFAVADVIERCDQLTALLEAADRPSGEKLTGTP